MATYFIKFTDISVPEITVHEFELDTTLDASLPGRIRLEWGAEINENFLRMLENFACPQDPNNTSEDVPYLDMAYDDLLSNPVIGQFWFNITNFVLYSYDGNKWRPYSTTGNEYGANWGQLAHGEQMPLPVSPNGYQFSYDECIWSVSPFHYHDTFNYVRCFSDAIDSTVTMQYKVSGTDTLIDGFVNYLIVGIRGNVNYGSTEDVPNPPTPTPTPTSTATNTPTPTPTQGGIQIEFLHGDTFVADCTDHSSNGSCYAYYDITRDTNGQGIGDYRVTGPGSGDFSILWEHTGGAVIHIPQPTLENVTIGRSETPPAYRNGTGRVTVTENGNPSNTHSITFTLQTTHNTSGGSTDTPTPTPTQGGSADTPTPTPTSTSTPTPTPTQGGSTDTPTPTPTELPPGWALGWVQTGTCTGLAQDPPIQICGPCGNEFDTVCDNGILYTCQFVNTLGPECQ